MLVFVDAVQEAGTFQPEGTDRLVLTREQMERKLRGRRASSKLPALIDLVLSRQLVTTGMIQSALTSLARARSTWSVR